MTLVADKRLAGIILAGGRSSRMGTDKAALPWGESDVLHTQLAVLATVCDELIVVSNKPRSICLSGVQMVSDRFIGCGPLGGFEAGLAAARPEVCVVVGCDMPFIDAGSMRYIAQAAAGFDAAVPFTNGRYQPLYACYQRSCLPLLRSQLQAGHYQLTELLAGLRIRSVSTEELAQYSPELLMLQNLNTPAEWQQAKEQLR